MSHPPLYFLPQTQLYSCPLAELQPTQQSAWQVAGQQLRMVAPVAAASKRGGAVVVRAMADDGRPTILVAEPLGEAGGLLRRIEIPNPRT